MSIHITTAMVEQYNANVQLLLQQEQSLFENAVRREPIHGEHEFFDQIGATEANKRTTRHGDTKYTNTDHQRRMVTSFPWDWADLIDKADRARILIDPQGAYTRNAVMAMNRAKDDEIIAAATGTAYGGKTGTTAYSISETIAVDYDASGTNTGLTLGKLIGAKVALQRNQIQRGEKLYFACRAKQLEDMLVETKATNDQYVNVKALIEGEITYFMGFNWIFSERLANSASTDITTCFAWAESGILLATAEEIRTMVDRLPGKNQSVQVWAGMDIGATRMEEKKVIPIYCDESP